MIPKDYSSTRDRPIMKISPSYTTTHTTEKW